jgi:hypothetical protein
MRYDPGQMPLRLPDYVREPVIGCIDSLHYMLMLLAISARGIGTVSRYPEMVQRVIDLKLEAKKLGSTKPEYEVTDDLKHKEEADKLGKFAADEVKNGFPFLHAFVTVGVWGILEVVVEDVLLGILLNEPASRDKDEIAKIRIPLSKYEDLDKEERMRFVLAELSRGNAPAQGISGFETLLRVFDLSGEVDETVKKNLWEMNHVRNVILHRGSYADSRLVQSCPWMGLKVGDRVLIDHERFGRYFDAANAYNKALQHRLDKRYGVSISTES